MTAEPAAAHSPALELEGVTHRFGSLLALDVVGLAVGRAEIVCLVGPSGCGKSTLLRLAAGLERLQEGRVRLGGRLVADPQRAVGPEARGIGLVFQDYALFPHLSALDNVRFGLAGLPGAERRARAAAALARVGMSPWSAAFPHMLSGGQQQRVALARALAPRPAVILLDEPFSGLDVGLRAQVRDETLHVLKENAAATVIVTHDPEEAMFLADRIVLMREGRVEQVGPPAELYTRPASAFAAAFFGEVNRIPAAVEAGVVETPFGRLPGGGACEGQAVEVLIRPEGLLLAEDAGRPGQVRARVEAARLLGRSSLVHLSVPDGRGGAIHMHARAPGQFLPPEDSTVSVTIDPRQAFVFPLQRAVQ
jgi:iron(III) transport system ATP-binding protein